MPDLIGPLLTAVLRISLKRSCRKDFFLYFCAAISSDDYWNIHTDIYPLNGCLFLFRKALNRGEVLNASLDCSLTSNNL